MLVYDVAAFGAVGGGERAETEFLQAAIDACAAGGGGIVELRRGIYLTGTLVLRSGVHLRIAVGAVLRGTTDITGYSDCTFKNMYRGESHMDRCLLYARGARSIEISGGGVIDGQGSPQNFPNAGDELRQRPMLIRFVECTDVRLHDLHLTDPAAWTTAFLYCSDITVERVDVSSRVNTNGDGFDFDGCRNVTVRHCSLDTSDDSICLQSSRADVDTRNIRISDCVLSSGWAGIRIGLLSRGTIADVVVERCRFDEIGDAAIKIQMCEGGVIEQLRFRRLSMTDVPRPVFVVLCRQRVGVDAPPQLPPLGTIDDLSFEDVSIDDDGDPGRAVIFFSGDVERAVGDIRLSGIDYRASGGLAEAPPPTLAEFTPRLLAGGWPEFELLGSPAPASVLYARHVRRLTVSNLDVHFAHADARPPIVVQDVGEISTTDLGFGVQPRS